MPTRKQRRRMQKERRHEYETVWVDAEGNELEEAPAEPAAPAREKRADGKPAGKAPQQRGGRPVRVPPPPSWRRSIKRSLIWVGVLGVLLVWLQSRAAHPSYGSAILMAAIYLLFFPVFTYYLDRMMYRRYQAKTQQREPRKR